MSKFAYPSRTRSAAPGASSPGSKALAAKGGDNRTFGGGKPVMKGTQDRGSSNRKRNSGTKNSAEGY